MQMKKETKFKISQKAHKRAIKKLEGKLTKNSRKLTEYHRIVLEKQKLLNRKLSKNEKINIINSL